MLGSPLWVATGQRQLILLQDMSLGEGASVLCPERLNALGLVLATSMVLKGLGAPKGGSEGEEVSAVRLGQLLAPSGQYSNRKVRL